MLKGFRAAISTDVNNIQGISSAAYTRVQFGTVLNDTSARYDPINFRWKPVIAGEPAQYVFLNAQVHTQGVRLEDPNTNCKILRNGEPFDAAGSPGGKGHYISEMPASGINGPIAGRAGWAANQCSLAILANPGDYFEVWTMANGWSPGCASLAYGFYSPAIAILGHYAHTWFSGFMLDPAEMQAMQTRVAALEARIVALEA